MRIDLVLYVFLFSCFLFYLLEIWYFGKKKFNSRIYFGEVRHTRLQPISNGFRYPVCYFAFDIDELPSLDQHFVGLFGYNKIRFISLFDKDYLALETYSELTNSSLKEKLYYHLRKRKIETESIGRIELISVPRIFNYAFNPVSFWYCFSNVNPSQVVCIVAEVHNTFGEKHIYILSEEKTKGDCNLGKKYYDKRAFHVSPFNNLEGDYQFYFKENLEEELNVRISIMKNVNKPFTSQLIAKKSSPIKFSNLCWVLVKSPTSILLTFPRISYQAAILHFKKDLPVFVKPSPSSTNTIGVLPCSETEKLFMKDILHSFQSLLSVNPQYYFELEFPDGHTSQIKSSNQSLEAIYIKIHSYSFFSRVGTDKIKGLAIALMNGEFSSPNLFCFLSLLNPDDLIYYNSFPYPSFSNLQLNTSFFQTFIEKDSSYSFGKDHFSLLLSNLGLTSQDRVLEIGCGVGNLTLSIVEQVGCHITSLTTNKSLFNYVKNQIMEKQLQNKIDLILIDSFETFFQQNQHKKFSKIISIEGLDELGKEFFLSDFSFLLDRLHSLSYENETKVFIQLISRKTSKKENSQYYPSPFGNYVPPSPSWPAKQFDKVLQFLDKSLTKYVASPYAIETRHQQFYFSVIPRKFHNQLFNCDYIQEQLSKNSFIFGLNIKTLSLQDCLTNIKIWKENFHKRGTNFIFDKEELKIWEFQFELMESLMQRFSVLQIYFQFQSK